MIVTHPRLFEFLPCSERRFYRAVRNGARHYLPPRGEEFYVRKIFTIIRRSDAVVAIVVVVVALGRFFKQKIAPFTFFTRLFFESWINRWMLLGMEFFLHFISGHLLYTCRGYEKWKVLVCLAFVVELREWSLNRLPIKATI